MRRLQQTSAGAVGLEAQARDRGRDPRPPRLGHHRLAEDHAAADAARARAGHLDHDPAHQQGPQPARTANAHLGQQGGRTHTRAARSRDDREVRAVDALAALLAVERDDVERVDDRHVGADAAVDRVLLAVAGADLVGSARAGRDRALVVPREEVAAGPAVEEVAAGRALDRVVAGAAADVVVAGAAVDEVVAAAALDRVVAPVAVEVLGGGVAGQGVGERRADHRLDVAVDVVALAGALPSPGCPSIVTAIAPPRSL